MARGHFKITQNRDKATIKKRPDNCPACIVLWELDRIVASGLHCSEELDGVIIPAVNTDVHLFAGSYMDGLTKLPKGLSGPGMDVAEELEAVVGSGVRPAGERIVA